MAATSVQSTTFAASPTTSTTTDEDPAARACLSDQHGPLSRLCPEIINQIFTLCVKDTEIHIGEFEGSEGRKKKWILEPGLLLASKEIRAIAKPMFYGGNAARRFYTTLDISMTGRRPKYEPCTVQAFKKAVSRFPECLENGSSLTVTIDNIGRSTLNSLAIIPELVRDFGFKEVDGEDTLKFIVTRSLDTPNKSWTYVAFHTTIIQEALNDLRHYAQVVSKNYRGMSKIQLVRAALIWLEIDNNWDRYPDSQYLRCRAGKRAVKGTWRMEEGRHYDADAIVMRQDCGMTLHPTSEELEAFYTRPWVNEEDEDRR